MHHTRPLILLFAVFTTGAAPLASRLHAQDFRQANLVSDVEGLAAHLDRNLVNPWGIAESPTSAFWVANAGSGVSTLYNSAGTPQSLVVGIPAPGPGPSAPIGIVFNPTSSFKNDRFIFASGRGTISGWKSTLGTEAEILADNSKSGAVYLGLATGSVDSKNYLYAANFARNGIDVFGGDGTSATLRGSFADLSIPAGYHPFNIQNLGGNLFVTYALQGKDGHDEAGAGHGFVDEFDLGGNLVGRIASGGVLDSPWGLALAPKSFGQFGGDLLVGNFGDGTINAFDPATGTFLGSLADDKGVPLVNEGLWALQFGNDAAGGRSDTLYFTAGIDDETHGLFGSIAPVPEPSTYGILSALTLLGLCSVTRRRRRMTAAAPL